MCPNAPADMISAIGSGGQFLNVVPSQNLVWLRMGDEPGNSNVPFLLNDQIWAYVNDLVCASTTIEENFNSEQIKLYPNPSNEQITISGGQGRLGKVQIYNQIGQKMTEFDCNSASKSLNLSGFENGLFFLVFPEKGITLKFIKLN
jgi:hypothetical protein